LKRYRTPIFAALSLATIAGVVFALGLIFGAWDLSGGSDGAGPGPGSSTEVLRERNGVKMTLSVDKEEYGPGEKVQVKLEIENTNDTDMPYRGRAPNDAGLKLEIASDLADPLPLAEGTEDDMAGTIEGGATIQRQAEWDEMLGLKLTPVTAPPGTYAIVATLLMFPEGFAEPIELGAAVNFEISGTGYVQPPIAAMRAMIAAEEVKAWAETRGDVIVCAYPSHKYFYSGLFSTGSADETFDFIYRQQVDAGDPICGIATEGDAWRFVLFSPKDGEPQRLTVHVALDEPVVLSVAEGGPTE
jgi:hypothetical protein